MSFFRKKFYKKSNNLCPRCEWPLENIKAQYVCREWDFPFFHCFNCGQDFYRAPGTLVKTDKGPVEQMSLKRVEVEIEYMINPKKDYLKKLNKWN
jgi:predicted amidophosphoribosyltransferase